MYAYCIAAAAVTLAETPDRPSTHRRFFRGYSDPFSCRFPVSFSRDFDARPAAPSGSKPPPLPSSPLQSPPVPSSPLQSPSVPFSPFQSPRPPPPKSQPRVARRPSRPPAPCAPDIGRGPCSSGASSSFRPAGASDGDPNGTVGADALLFSLAAARHRGARKTRKRDGLGLLYARACEFGVVGAGGLAEEDTRRKKYISREPTTLSRPPPLAAAACPRASSRGLEAAAAALSLPPRECRPAGRRRARNAPRRAPTLAARKAPPPPPPTNNAINPRRRRLDAVADINPHFVVFPCPAAPPI